MKESPKELLKVFAQCVLLIGLFCLSMCYAQEPITPEEPISITLTVDEIRARNDVFEGIEKRLEGELAEIRGIRSYLRALEKEAIRLANEAKKED